MSKLIVYYAHPGQKHSNVNRLMYAEAKKVDGISLVDLYAEYPRFEIDVDREQKRLLANDVILFQFPLFWYSTPSLVKEWLDLVLELGFAYGVGGNALNNKRMVLAVSAAGSAEAYTTSGYQRYPLRTFLTPLECTAGLCGMRYTPPYVLYESLQALKQATAAPHASGYKKLLETIRDDRFDFDAADTHDVITFNTIPVKEGT